MGFGTWYLRGLAIDYCVVDVLLGYTRLRHHAAIFGSWLDLIICNNGVLSVELMFRVGKIQPLGSFAHVYFVRLSLNSVDESDAFRSVTGRLWTVQTSLFEN